jgi:hypothetical protein
VDMRAQTDAAETLEPLLSIRETGWLPAFLVKALARGAKSRALSELLPRERSLGLGGFVEDGLEHDAELSLSLDTLDKIQRYAKPAHN